MSVNFIKGIIEHRMKIKRGFTIIEMLIVVSMVAAITTVQIRAVSKYMELHRKEINYSRESFYVNEAFMIIENQVINAKYIDIKDNMIVLKRYDNKGYDYIKKHKNNCIVISYGSSNSSTLNNILKGIKDFKVKRLGRVFYVSINMEKGNLYKRCFAIEREKLTEDLY
ncbi:competence type IV pilus minor pilin ComGF [Clostridium luticellarii]|uniref:competence type IV pilus minor pilin ComGF n=2 Tax=Clostridium luticellarii TaxID=1691940 RepID=UPI0023562049|nr:competence type IV pilus minor pilin ComGF [Clostridium luticellarii]MCI1943735.1 prepilin-type N-terminal cleavage/methylation domain-containing protein [Clostridium luticellarii]MCI1966996.1 prepilin-type N-terminal cleavage/methylation domain-containing protein [Clostridium luticellarii]MCI1994363.1 prepilin-type N-terminal cleavage/methylation domain-containing protein [Clostridium luticellarii]